MQLSSICALVLMIPVSLVIAQEPEQVLKNNDHGLDIPVVLDFDLPGKIEFQVVDPEVERYLVMMDSLDAKSSKTEGYRIQVFSASGPNAKEIAFDKQSEFLQYHTNTTSYTLWNYPNWVLRIGDFRTRLEAVQFHQEVRSSYPASFIIKDEIEIDYE